MVRDSTFLNWRFDCCPGRRYTRHIAERDGQIVGYIVTREQQLGGRTQGLIVDFLVHQDDRAAFESLVRKALDKFAAHGVAAVTCPISSSQAVHIRLLRQLGFAFRRHRAHIVAHRGPLLESITSIKDWYITFADTDGDYSQLEDENALNTTRGSERNA